MRGGGRLLTPIPWCVICFFLTPIPLCVIYFLLTLSLRVWSVFSSPPSPCVWSIFSSPYPFVCDLFFPHPHLLVFDLLDVFSVHWSLFQNIDHKHDVQTKSCFILTCRSTKVQRRAFDIRSKSAVTNCASERAQWGISQVWPLTAWAEARQIKVWKGPSLRFSPSSWCRPGDTRSLKAPLLANFKTTK